MRTGLIGTGYMSRTRARAIATMEPFTLAWVCSRDGGRARAFLEDLQGEDPEAASASALDDWQAAIGRSDTDAVMICTPNSEHFEPARVALRAGKHVLVEYPPTTTVAQAEELLDLAAERGLAFHVGLTYLYGPLHQALKEMLSSSSGVPGPLGDPLAYVVTTCSGRPISGWYDKDELGGGAFVSSFYDIIGQAMDLLGPVRDVHARYTVGRRQDGTIGQDCGNVMLAFDSGCTGQITYARGGCRPGLGSTTTILCRNGYLIVSGGKIRKLTPDGEEVLDPSGPGSTETDMLAFVEAARNAQTADPTGPAALTTLRVAAEAARAAG